MLYTKAYIINVLEKPDRLAACQTRLAKVGITAERFAGNETSFTTSQVMRAVIAQMMEDDVEVGLVLEDDVIFHKDFVELAAAAEAEIPEDWAALFYGRYVQSGVPIGENLLRVGYGLGMHCVAFNKPYFDQLLQVFSTPASFTNQHLALCSILSAYSTRPVLTAQLPGISNRSNRYVDYNQTYLRPCDGFIEMP